MSAFRVRAWTIVVATAVAGVVLAPSPPAALAARFGVDSTEDDVDAAPGDGLCRTAAGACTLRAAVQETNALAGEDEIRVPAGTYLLTRQDVEDDVGATGDLDVHDRLRVIGDGPDATIVDGNRMSRLFDATATPRLALVGLRLRHGEASYGGAVYAPSPLVLKRVVVESNHAYVAGGVAGFGRLRIFSSSVQDNVATIAPGLAVASGPARVRDSTFAGNTLEGSGPPVGGSDILANGGGRLVIVNSTIAGEIGNLAYCNPPPDFFCSPGNDVVLANVTADVVSFRIRAFEGGSYTVRNSIIGSCLTPIVSQGYVLAGSECTVGGDLTGVTTGVDPMLDELEDNGGPTRTRLPLPASPAIDAGNPAPPGSGPTACVARDQRGVVRPAGERCDIGAVEVGP
ncbi:MAG TPA: choice-of-anchor Q domain-containing protein [Candidatus Binatia bacterium]|nr:choice-of-anchor Q domain-containing protein [Candidatus Binatia bacterium]